jgi:hypothetical protein
MSKSQASRARTMARVDRQLNAQPPVPHIPDQLKIAIARIVRGVSYINPTPGGNCTIRALFGRTVLQACGLRSAVIPGGMLYRCGPDPQRDTIRFCSPPPDQRGGYLYGGMMVGHIWNELGDDLIDFSAGDWKAETDIVEGSDMDLSDKELGPIQWDIPPPPFIWQGAITLKRPWRSTGEPPIGRAWYAPWASKKHPDCSGYDDVLEMMRPSIIESVRRSGIIERLADANR